jgi:hypothetical protein
MSSANESELEHQGRSRQDHLHRVPDPGHQGRGPMNRPHVLRERLSEENIEALSIMPFLKSICAAHLSKIVCLPDYYGHHRQ